MAIQLSNFTPLQFKHYQLAETQREKDAENQRRLSQIGLQGAYSMAQANVNQKGQSDRQAAALADTAIARDMDQQNKQFDQERMLNTDQAKTVQQGIDNAYRDRQLGLQESNYDADNRRADRQLGLSEAADSRAQQKADREDEDYRSMAPLKGQTLALAKIGGILDSVDVDKDGAADATKYKEDLAKVWGFDPEKYQTITLKGDKETNRLQAFGFDGKNSVPITLPSGQAISVSHDAIHKATQMLMGGDSKYRKAQAELEQTQLENKQKQTELDYMVKHGVKMGAAGQEKQNVTISTNQIGGSNILNKDEGTLTVTDPKGKIISTTKIPGVGAANQAAQGVYVQQPQGPQKMTAQQAYEVALSSGDKGRAERIKQMAMQRGDWQ